MLQNTEEPQPGPPKGAHAPLSYQFPALFSPTDLPATIADLYLKTEVDLNVCQQIWEEFSPKASLFDTWSFRLAFYHAYQFQPYFITLRDKTRIFAVLPLWYNPEKKEYQWFGSWWHENNSFFARDPVFIPALLKIAPQNLWLNAISATEAAKLKNQVMLEPEEAKYVLHLDKFNNLDEYLSSLKKKKRYNLKRDKKFIDAQQPQIFINRFNDFDNMVKTNKARFDSKGPESSLQDPRDELTLANILKLANSNQEYQVRMVTVEIGGKVAGIDLIVIYKNIYYPLKGGNNVADFPGIGNYLTLYEIEDAINLGMKKVDVLQNDYGWKESMFEREELFQYKK